MARPRRGNIFRIESLRPNQIIRSDSGDQAFLWTVPARVEWRWSFGELPGLPRLSVQIRQRKPFFNAQVFVDGAHIALIEYGKVAGSRLSLDFSRGNTRYQIQGEVQGQQFMGLLNGTARVSGTLSP